MPPVIKYYHACHALLSVLTIFQMESEQFIIKMSPEAPLLSDYLADNPRPPCPLVGLEHVTEFRHSRGFRPYYHCSLPGCFNDQVRNDEFRWIRPYLICLYIRGPADR